MAFRVELSRRAARDLDNIYLRIQAASSQQAAAWFNGLELTIQRLGLFPARGARAREGSDLLQMPYGKISGNYRILYRIDETNETVFIATIRHSARKNWAPGEDPAER